MQNYGFRIYNPQLAKFLSVDPLTDSYPFYTPYQFAGGNPIMSIDLDGLEPHEVVAEDGSVVKSSVEEPNVATVTPASSDQNEAIADLSGKTIQGGSVAGCHYCNDRVTNSNSGEQRRRNYVEKIDYENGQILPEVGVIGGTVERLLGYRTVEGENGETINVGNDGYPSLRYYSFTMPWYASVGPGKFSSSKQAASWLRNAQPLENLSNSSVVNRYNKNISNIQKMMKAGGKPNAILAKVWSKISSIERSKFKRALQRGVIGVEGKTKATGILELTNTKMLNKGYTHKLWIPNSNNRLYGKKVNGKWSFDRLGTHDNP